MIESICDSIEELTRVPWSSMLLLDVPHESVIHSINFKMLIFMYFKKKNQCLFDKITIFQH